MPGGEDFKREFFKIVRIKMKVFLNNELIEKDTIEDLFEPGFLFGWGVFETLRVYKKKIPFLDLHIERLNSSLSLLGIEPPRTDWANQINNLLEINNLDDAYVRLTVYKKRKSTGVYIYADKFTYYPEDTYKRGFCTLVSKIKRFPTWDSKVKSLSYLNCRMSWLEAQVNNKDEAIVLNSKDRVVGGSRSNIFIIQKNRVLTPSLSEEGVFSGITRRVVIEVIKKEGLDLEEKEIKLEDIFLGDGAFFTSSLLEVMPLVECENRKIGEGRPHEIALNIRKLYRKIIYGEG